MRKPRRTMAQIRADEEAVRREKQRKILDEMSLRELVEYTLDAALEIGSSNWDSYLEPNRRPELEDCEAYKELMRRVAGGLSRG